MILCCFVIYYIIIYNRFARLVLHLFPFGLSACLLAAHLQDPSLEVNPTTQLKEVEVLVNGLAHVPSTTHPCRKCYKVSLSHRHWLSVVSGSHCDLSLQDVATLVAFVRPRKFARLTPPCTPLKYWCVHR